MSNLANNLRAIESTVERLNVETREGRNAVIRRYHRRLSPSVQDSLVFRHGSAVYPNKPLEKFFQLINRRPIHFPIYFTGGDDNALLARAANDLSNMVYARGLRFRDSGAHLASLEMHIREVGGEALIRLQSGRVSESMLPDRAVVSVVPVIEYASALEMHAQGGVLYHVAKHFRAKYGQALAVKFDYVSGKRIGYSGGTYPRIQIGHFGNLRPRMTTPGRSAGRRRRRRRT